VLGEIGGGLALHDHVPPLDAGATAYPLVAGVDQPLEVGVGQDLFRQVAPGACDT
jgi:hypothetical protein